MEVVPWLPSCAPQLRLVNATSWFSKGMSGGTCTPSRIFARRLRLTRADVARDQASPGTCPTFACGFSDRVFSPRQQPGAREFRPPTSEPRRRSAGAERFFFADRSRRRRKLAYGGGASGPGGSGGSRRVVRCQAGGAMRACAARPATVEAPSADDDQRRRFKRRRGSRVGACRRGGRAARSASGAVAGLSRPVGTVTAVQPTTAGTQPDRQQGAAALGQDRGRGRARTTPARAGSDVECDPTTPTTEAALGAVGQPAHERVGDRVEQPDDHPDAAASWAGYHGRGRTVERQSLGRNDRDRDRPRRSRSPAPSSWSLVGPRRPRRQGERRGVEAARDEPSGRRRAGGVPVRRSSASRPLGGRGYGAGESQLPVRAVGARRRQASKTSRETPGAPSSSSPSSSPAGSRDADAASAEARRACDARFAEEADAEEETEATEETEAPNPNRRVHAWGSDCDSEDELLAGSGLTQARPASPGAERRRVASLRAAVAARDRC